MTDNKQTIEQMMTDWHNANQFSFNPQLWFKLIAEEHAEVRSAILDKAVAQGEDGDYVSQVRWNDPRGDEFILAELADLIIVTMGMIMNMGYDPTEVVALKHESNMSKFCKTELEAINTVDKLRKNSNENYGYRKLIGPAGLNNSTHYIVYRKSDGKTMKGINYKPADYSKLITSLERED